ncbi:MAG: CPBP family intramembrane metalloprotease [Planctomycetes bacterium]|nr:CPBP family intramembrane metalloprotease [Planctomycetota bacterium]
MSASEWQRLGLARRDPAVSVLLLLPLALLHLSGRQKAQAGAFAIVEYGLEQLRWLAPVLLLVLSVVTLLWSLGRIRLLEIPWRGGAILLVVEGIFWGWALGPILTFLTHLASGQVMPIAVDWSQFHGQLALCAGAGLYEELLFRYFMMSGMYVLFCGFFSTFASREAARTFSFGLALLLSSLAFSLAHALGDPSALDADPFLFRLMAGLVLGLLFSWRGLAVVAYAHATYDAQLLLF